MNKIVINTDSQNFERDVIKSDLPVVVDFYSEDCPPCEALATLFDKMAEKYSEHIKFVKIFRQKNRPLAERYDVKSSPTLMFFKGGSEVCGRLTGYISSPEFKSAIESVLAESCVSRTREKIECDVLILGGGPAGFSAALYASRAKLNTIIVDEGLSGGQVSTTFHVANYPGTNGVVRGIDLMENMKKQAVDFGTELHEMKEILKVNLEEDIKHIETEDTDYFATSVIIATGAIPRKLPADGEREFRGRGVHYCATCDGAMYQDADVLVIGGGNSALEEAVFLTRYAKHVTIIHRSSTFRASKAAQDEAFENPGISVILDTEVRKVSGENFVQSVLLENVKTKETKEIKTDGLFVYIGMEPKTALFKDIVRLDEYGYILTDEDMMTNLPGVFAAGDIRAKKVRQIATATGDGVIAGIMAEKYIHAK